MAELRTSIERDEEAEKRKLAENSREVLQEYKRMLEVGAVCVCVCARARVKGGEERGGEYWLTAGRFWQAREGGGVVHHKLRIPT